MKPIDWELANSVFSIVRKLQEQTVQYQRTYLLDDFEEIVFREIEEQIETDETDRLL